MKDWPSALRRLKALISAALLACVVVVASQSSAQAVCDQTVDSTTGATINFSSPTQTYHLCFQVNVPKSTQTAADDAVLWGIYDAAGIDSFTYYPITGTSTTAATPYSVSKTHADYTVTVTDNGGEVNSGQSGIDIKIDTLRTFGQQETITLWYAQGCSDAAASCSGSTTDTQYVLTINLPTAPPTVTSISPTSGPIGTSVTITGTNFTGATAVKFGATNATSYTFNSATQITAVAPTGTGTVDVTVTTGGGTSATSVNDQFTYIPAPTVTSVTPTAGPTAGGTSAVITGTNLTGATAVRFGASNASSYAVDSATQITATSPGGSGTVDITVTTPGGTSAISASDQFTYVGTPTVTSIAPTSGPTGGSTSVIITGTNLSGATAVNFGASSATGFTVNSATQITATSPAGAGTVNVTVTTPGGTSATSAADQFTYVSPPTVSAISPTSGPASGGTSVIITGTNLTTTTAVRFGANNATSFIVNSATQVTATSPSGSGTVDVTVTTAGGTSATSASDQFTYLPAPAVTSISPTSGPAGGGTSVTITGTGFTGVTAVRFGASNAGSLTVNSATQITATSPAGTGVVNVTVTTANGTSATTAADQFTYTGGPTVTSIAPTSGPITGGTSVTITGTNFTAVTAVRFGAANAASYVVNSATQITATSPAGTGTVDITVTTASGTSATSAADQFTYIGAPTVTSLVPAAGPPTGGTSVTITGTNFNGATAVRFGATNAASFTVNSSTQITATSPAGSGVVDVTVTTAIGTSAISPADRFTYIAGAAVTSVAPTVGPATGGTNVTISGSGFTGASAVRFGAANAASFTVTSDTSISAISPAGTGTVDIIVVAPGGTSTASPADRFTYQLVTTQAALASSQNPSSFGQAVTFTATVTGVGGTPTGTVTFSDNGAVLGSAALSNGTASLAVSTLAVGSHSIVASYGGSGAFAPSNSTALSQTVNVPADSVKLRALQVEVTRMVAQNSGQAISGAVDNAIVDGFSQNDVFIAPGQTGVRFNFAADPVDPDDAPAKSGKSDNASTSSGAGGLGSAFANTSLNPGRGRGRDSRVDDAFNAIDQQMPKKSLPARFREQKDWLFWVDVRGSGVSRTNTSTTLTGVSVTQTTLYGLQVNALAGLTYRLRPDLVVGVLGGYETFNFTNEELNGKLTGDGWTLGSYLGWKITPTLRYDVAVAYSGIGYDGSAGTAHGSFNGQRWMVQTGLTGTHKVWGAIIEPSAKIYALWESENAYVDSLGTQQAERNFATGRASGGTKVIYPMAWEDRDILFAPYIGIYGDYYFTRDDAGDVFATGGVPLASTPLLQGWSARATAGLGVRFANGGAVGLGGEYGGIGSDYKTWTAKARAQMPFSAAAR